MSSSVERHPWWTDSLSRYFQEECERYERFLQGARREPWNLHLFFTVAKNVYLAGSVVEPTSLHVANALRWCAQALTAIFAFQEGKEWPTDFILGHEPVTYSKPANPQDPDLVLWHTAFNLSLISRQPTLTDRLCQFTRDDFRHSAVVGIPSGEYITMDVNQAIWKDLNFVESGVFKTCDEGIARNAADPAKEQDVVRRLSVPYMNAARALGRRDSAAFQDALVEGLKGHKAHWTSKKKLQEDLKGMVSLPLTGLASLAWDRGLRFEVDSGYLPWPWVTGELFRDLPSRTG